MAQRGIVSGYQAAKAEPAADDLRRVLKVAVVALNGMKMGANDIPGGCESSMPEIVRTFWEAYNMEPAKETWARPAREAIGIADKVIPWTFLIMQPRHRKIALLRALGLSWRRIGTVAGCSHQMAAYYEGHAINNMLRGMRKDLTIWAEFDSIRGRLAARAA